MPRGAGCQHAPERRDSDTPEASQGLQDGGSAGARSQADGEACPDLEAAEGRPPTPPLHLPSPPTKRDPPRRDLRRDPRTCGRSPRSAAAWAPACPDPRGRRRSRQPEPPADRGGRLGHAASLRALPGHVSSPAPERHALLPDGCTACHRRRLGRCGVTGGDPVPSPGGQDGF